MISVCWALKGGSGTTVIAASMALSRCRPALLVDLDGDIPPALGIPEPAGPGVAEWLTSGAASGRLSDLVVDVSEHVMLLPRGPAVTGPQGRWDELARWLQADGRDVIVDAGTTSTPADALLRVADERILVTRPCYLALRRAVRTAQRPTGVVVVHEPGRQLDADDVANGIGAPVLAVVLLDPKIARAVDAGLLVSRLPSAFRRGLRWTE
jgi:MinD superfamily P-loop ATPase